MMIGFSEDLTLALTPFTNLSMVATSIGTPISGHVVKWNCLHSLEDTNREEDWGRERGREGKGKRKGIEKRRKRGNKDRRETSREGI